MRRWIVPPLDWRQLTGTFICPALLYWDGIFQFWPSTAGTKRAVKLLWIREFNLYVTSAKRIVTSRGSAYRCSCHDQLPSDDTRWHHHCDKSRRSDAERYRFFLTTLIGMRFSTRQMNLSASRCKIVSPTAILMIIIYAGKNIIRYVICIFLCILVSWWLGKCVVSVISTSSQKKTVSICRIAH